jgi:hypothetical protein
MLGAPGRQRILMVTELAAGAATGWGRSCRTSTICG